MIYRIQVLPYKLVAKAVYFLSNQGKQRLHGLVKKRHRGKVSMNTKARNIVPKFKIM